MLIRLMGHFLKNSQHIDKLICIKGLPDDWVFRHRTDGAKELRSPWEPDVDANIPAQVRHLCEPMEIVKYFSPIEKGRDGIVDPMTILGVKLNYMTEPGRDMWSRIERYIDDSIPRDMKLPEPVLVAKDQKSPFETYKAIKRVTGGVELIPAEVPVVDLDMEWPQREPRAQVAQEIQQPRPVAIPAGAFKCDHCDYISEKKQAILMHTTRKHPKKEKVGV